MFTSPARHFHLLLRLHGGRPGSSASSLKEKVARQGRNTLTVLFIARRPRQRARSRTRRKGLVKTLAVSQLRGLYAKLAAYFMSDFSTFGWIHSSNVVLGKTVHCFCYPQCKAFCCERAFFALSHWSDFPFLLLPALSFILILDHFILRPHGN